MPYNPKRHKRRDKVRWERNVTMTMDMLRAQNISEEALIKVTRSLLDCGLKEAKSIVARCKSEPKLKIAGMERSTDDSILGACNEL